MLQHDHYGEHSTGQYDATGLINFAIVDSFGRGCSSSTTISSRVTERKSALKMNPHELRDVDGSTTLVEEVPPTRRQAGRSEAADRRFHDAIWATSFRG